MVHCPAQRNLHRDGILAVTEVHGARRAAGAGAAGRRGRAAPSPSGLDYVGVLCVEFFVLQDGALVVNEMAPRPHNSGHYSMDACDVSQFELQVRTLAGLPLVPPRQHSPAIMLNLLGDLWFADGEAGAHDPPWAARAGAARHPPAPVRQAEARAGPQDGAPEHHRRRPAQAVRDTAAAGRRAAGPARPC